MSIGDPIEEQCVRMWKIVSGHSRMTMDEARREFWCQNPATIDGWERLARQVNKVTTAATLAHVEEMAR